MISTSPSANTNYLAKLVCLKGLRKHDNADRLQVVTIDFQNVITGPDAKDGDLYVFFPLECQINSEFLAATNSFRDKTLNKDQEQAGFFEKNARVRAVKLRGEKSMGYLVPQSVVEDFFGDLGAIIGEEFDTVNGKEICRKYVVKTRNTGMGNRQGKKPRISRLVEGQVKLHVDTENLRKMAYKVKPEDIITISYKAHGTSFWVSNLLVKRKLNLIERGLKALGVKIKDTEYDFVYGSRKVVKNEFETEGKSHFYDTDIWGEIKEDLKEFLPKGYTVYGEAVGYTSNGSAIQGEYDYGCQPGERKLMIYRMTFTNEDGLSNDLTTPQIEEFCKHFNLGFIHVFYHGRAGDMYPELDKGEHWNVEFIKRLEKDYNDKDCFMCFSAVPEEGIVLRKEKMFEFEAYKLKSWRFLEYETKLLDEGTVDMESDQ